MEGTDIPVVAWIGVVHMEASIARLTSIVRTSVSIITCRGLGSNACTVFARRFAGTRVSVIACVLVGRKDTFAVFAGIVGAHASVKTRHRRARLALSTRATVALGAGIAVAAGAVGGRVGASSIGEARIHRAGISVVAAKASKPHAIALIAGIALRAIVLVVAG